MPMQKRIATGRCLRNKCTTEPTLLCTDIIDLKGSTLYVIPLCHFVGIVLIVSQYLFDMDDFRAGVPCDTTAHQIPILAFLDGNFL